jgi:phage gp29-like protein
VNPVVQLQQARPRPDVEEIATAGRDITRGFVGAILPNPDEVLAREAAGKGFDLYDEMEDKDPQIASLLQTRRLGVLSKEREVVPASNSQRDLAIADFVRRALFDVPRFDEDLDGLLDAIAKGFAVAEVLWRVEGGRVVIDDIRSRNQDRFVFSSDGALRLRTRESPFEGVALPGRKFLVHRHGRRYENPYGEAVLKSVYWYWWFKKNVIKFWVIFAEKFGMPTAVGKYPEGTKSDKQDELLAACEAIQTENAVVIPERMVIELLEAKRRGGVETYQAFCEYLDAQIAKAILGATLTSGEGRHGTQALGTVHASVRQDILEADARSLETTINDQLIRWLVDFNFSGVGGYPALAIQAEEPEDLRALAERDERLVRRIGLPVAAGYFYDRYRIPPPSAGEAPVGEDTRTRQHPIDPDMEGES